MKLFTEVFIVDDHVILCEGLVSLLDSFPNIKVVGHSTGGLKAIEAILKVRPDVVMTDIVMPHMSGIDLVSNLREQTGDSIRFVVLSMYTSSEYEYRALKAGVCGYASKDAPADELADIIVHATRANPRFSRTVTSSGVMPQDLEIGGYGGDDDPGFRLSPRETEVLRLIAEGCRNKEIAERLCVSFKTVEAHKASLMKKIGSHNYSDLIRYAVTRGLDTSL